MNYNSLTDFITALEALKANLPTLIIPNVRKAGVALSSAVINRVVTKGVDDNGVKFSPYSAKHKIKRKRLGSAPFGTQGSMKNFYMTGTMWNNFGVRKVSVEGERILSTIDFVGSNVYTNNKELAEIHEDNEGRSLTTPTQKEEDDFVMDLAESIVEIIKSRL